MADGFIVRKGGVTTEQALAPTITEVSTTQTSITFTITNNDASTAVILYEVDDATPDENSVELAAAATSGNIEITGLSVGEHDVYATANVTDKVKSNVTELTIEIEPLVYTAATGGTTAEYDDGGTRYKSHTFTSNGNFVVTQVGDSDDNRNKVDYLIIAGGGSGGGSVFGSPSGGGGGAGGFRTTVTPVPSNQSPNAKVTVTEATFGVTIGAGGTGVVNITGENGSNSQVSFNTNIISTGGGGGGAAKASGLNGGSGGGSGGENPSVSPSPVAGTGITGQGRNGGKGRISTGSKPGGGGGGAGGVGGVGIDTLGGAGGVGLSNNLRTGSNETRANGGVGSNANIESAVVSGGANTGAGGSGVRNGATTGAGGSGIVVIRYEIAPSV